MRPISGTILLLVQLALAVSARGDTEESASVPTPVYLYDGDTPAGFSYATGVEELIAAWETDTATPLIPGRTGKAALKIYTNSGLGLETPADLVLAVAAALERRGFERGNILIVDLDERRMRQAGYLPALSQGGDHFEGMPVVDLDNPSHFLEEWFYEDALPSDARVNAQNSQFPRRRDSQDRKSYLPAPLLFEADFWINLPVALEHPILGISGSLANGSLWAVSNQSRFFEKPVSAASAAAEIAAIPELQRTWIFSILSLERFQIIGGPRFNAHYTHGKPEILLSEDALFLDRYALATINAVRIRRGFDPISPEPLLFRYGEILDLGDSELRRDRITTVLPQE